MADETDSILSPKMDEGTYHAPVFTGRARSTPGRRRTNNAGSLRKREKKRARVNTGRGKV